MTIPRQRGRCASALLALVLSVFGCESSALQRRRLASDYPLDRARAAVALAETGDANAIHQLVELLDDDDRGVRLYSILSLERLTGQTYGYVYYGRAAERDAAVRRWREALRNGEVTVGAQPEAGKSNERG